MAEESKEEESKKIKKEISDDVRNLVIERLDIIPSDKRFFIGSNEKGFTKSELIECVKRGDEIGQDVVEMEMSFLKALKEGTLLEEINQELAR